MYAMIVIDFTDEKMFIPYDGDEKLKLVHSDQDAQNYVVTNLPNCRLLGTFPDPAIYISTVLKERDDARKKEKGPKKQPRSKRS